MFASVAVSVDAAVVSGLLDDHSLLGLPLALLGIVSEPDDLNDLLLVEVFEAGRGYDVVVVLFSEEEAGLLEALAVEGVGVLEDLAHALNGDVLGEDLLAPLLERGHVEAVSEREQLVDVLGLDLDRV